MSLVLPNIFWLVYKSLNFSDYVTKYDQYNLVPDFRINSPRGSPRLLHGNRALYHDVLLDTLRHLHLGRYVYLFFKFSLRYRVR